MYQNNTGKNGKNGKNDKNKTHEISVVGIKEQSSSYVSASVTGSVLRALIENCILCRAGGRYLN